MLSRADLLTRHGELQTLRQREEPQWRQIARLLRPGDEDIGSGTVKDNFADDIFDSSPLYALENFVGGLYSHATSPTDRWFELGVGDEDLMRWRPVKQWLFRRSNILLQSFSPAVSSYYTEAPAVFSDLGAFGVGSGYSEERPAQGRILDRAIPLSELWFDADFDGNPNTVHRKFRRTVRAAREMFPGKLTTLDERREIEILPCVYPNPDFRAGVLGRAGQAYLSAWASPDVLDFLVYGGYYELPYYVIPWNRRAGPTASGTLRGPTPTCCRRWSARISSPPNSPPSR